MFSKLLLIWEQVRDGMVGVFDFVTNEYTILGIDFVPIVAIFGGGLIIYLATKIVTSVFN